MDLRNLWHCMVLSLCTPVALQSVIRQAEVVRMEYPDTPKHCQPLAIDGQ